MPDEGRESIVDSQSRELLPGSSSAVDEVRGRGEGRSEEGGRDDTAMTAPTSSAMITETMIDLENKMEAEAEKRDNTLKEERKQVCSSQKASIWIAYTVITQ